MPLIEELQLLVTRWEHDLATYGEYYSSEGWAWADGLRKAIDELEVVIASELADREERKLRRKPLTPDTGKSNTRKPKSTSKRIKVPRG